MSVYWLITYKKTMTMGGQTTDNIDNIVISEHPAEWLLGCIRVDSSYVLLNAVPISYDQYEMLSGRI